MNPFEIAPFVAAIAWNEQGLVPVIAQDAATGRVRMFAWANAEAVRATARTGFATFFSRSRNALWEKGATSGNRLVLREMRLDCDGDAVLYLCDPQGPTCHEGPTSCFSRRATTNGDLARDDGPTESDAAVIEKVAAVIAARRGQDPDSSYVASLLQKGWPKILEKIAEESGELRESLPGDDRAHTAHEAADLLFHMLVGLEAAHVPVADVLAELRRRFGTSGHAEKASRAPQ